MLLTLAQAAAEAQAQAETAAANAATAAPAPVAADPAGGNPENIFEIVNSILSRGDALTHGDQLTATLQNMSMVWAVVFLIAGLVTLVNGYKYYKIVTVLLALSIGCFGGYYLGQRVGSPYIVAGCLALLLAVCSMPLMKYAVAVMGGLAGAFIGANLWAASISLFFEAEQAQALQDTYWVGALVGLIVLGMLAFIVFKLSVVLFTSVSGSTVAVLGAIALTLQVPNWQSTIVEGVSAHPIIIPLMVLVPAAIGLLMQEIDPVTGGKRPAKAPAATVN